MSDKKWTPGPWRIKQTGNIGNCVEAKCGQWDYGDYYSTVATFQPANNLRAELTAAQEAENAAANGYLIAAAPELYETLDELRKWAFDFAASKGDVVPDTLAADVEAALAKARGEQ